MDSAMRPARLAVILGTVCALGAGAPAIALAAESPAPVVARQDAGASDLTTLTISEDATSWTRRRGRMSTWAFTRGWTRGR